MRFLLDDEQRVRPLAGRDADGGRHRRRLRAWGAGDHAPGRGAVGAARGGGRVRAGRCPRSTRGWARCPSKLAVAFVELGRHAVPGPVVETVAAAALLTQLAAGASGGLPNGCCRGLAAGEPRGDADPAGRRPVRPGRGYRGRSSWSSTDETLRLAPGHARVRRSLDPGAAAGRAAARRRDCSPRAPPVAAAAAARDADGAAACHGRPGAGRRPALLAGPWRTRSSARSSACRSASFQAVKHRLADALLAWSSRGRWCSAAATTLAPAERGRGEGGGGRGGLRGGPRRAPTARRARLHRGARPLPVAPKARALRGAWGDPGVWRARALAGYE